MKKSLIILIPILSTFALSACGGEKGHTHTYGQLVEAIDPTCQNEGVKAHYYCQACDTYFDEEKFEINYENLVIPMLHHRYDQYSYNDNEHYKECIYGCGTRVESNLHTSTGVLYFDQGHHWYQCECGYVMSKDEHHVIDSTYVHAEGVDYHYRVCSCGQILDKATHSFILEVETDEYLDESSIICGQKPHYFKSCLCGSHGEETFESKIKPVVTHNYIHTYDESYHFEECTICHNKINSSAHNISSTIIGSGEFRGYENKACNDCEYSFVPALTYQTFDNYVNSLTTKGVTGNKPFDRRPLEAGLNIYNKLPSSEQQLVTKKSVLDSYLTNYDSKFYVAYDMFLDNPKFTVESSSLYGLDIANHDDPVVGRYMNVNVLTNEAATPTTGSTTLDKIKQFKFNHNHKNPLTFTPKSLTLAVEASYNPRFISFTSCNWVFQLGTNIPGTNWYTYTLVGNDLDIFVFQYTRENCLYRFGKYENNQWSLPQETFKLANFVFEY